MRRPVFLSLLACGGLLSTPGHAGTQDGQLWLTESAVVRLGGSYRLSQETNLRFGDRNGGLYEAETILMVGTRLVPGVVAWAGYVHDPLYDGGHFRVMEHRFREQINIDDLVRLGPGTISVRARLEQRWREGNPGTAWRVRPVIRYAVPLGSAKITSLQFSHESFIDLNTTGFQTVIGEDRMRNAISVRTALSRAAALECGYINQYRIVPGGGDQVDHALSMTISFQL